MQLFIIAASYDGFENADQFQAAANSHVILRHLQLDMTLDFSR
jgi:hypothetical protein